MLIAMLVAILATVSVAIMVILIVSMMGTLIAMVLVGSTWHYQGDDSDYDYVRDSGDGDVVILVNMMV